jgi:hypothetical protein
MHEKYLTLWRQLLSKLKYSSFTIMGNMLVMVTHELLQLEVFNLVEYVI